VARLLVDERREQLVALGLEHFGRKAYDEVSVDHIADAAGISKGLLYHYFPTKRAYYVACVERAAADLVAACTEAIPTNLPPLEQLDRGITAYLEYVRAHDVAYANLMIRGVAFPEVARIVDETRQALIDDLLAGMQTAVKLTPMLRIAMRGWVGFAETATLEWAREKTRISVVKMRDLLKSALFAILSM